jgi:hypothetical protein
MWVSLLMIAVVLAGEEGTGKPGITRANCEQLVKGMTLAQGETLLGQPAERAWDHRIYSPPLLDSRRMSWLGRWKSKEANVTLWFDENDKVSDGYWESPPESGNLIPIPLPAAARLTRFFTLFRF